MVELISQSKDILDLLFNLVIIIVPLFATWLLRNWVKHAGDEKKIATIIRVANTAIDYAEDLDQRGDLEQIVQSLPLPVEIQSQASKGIQKLNVAGKWVEHELKQMGISITNEEAQNWIAAEYQRRLGTVGGGAKIVGQTGEVIKLLEALQARGLISLPPHLRKITDLTRQIDDWLAGARPQAVAETMAAVASASQSPLPSDVFPVSDSVTPEPSAEEQITNNQLADLAAQAVEYVEELKASYDLTIPDLDIATAWMLTEVTKRGISVRPEQIAGQIRAAFAHNE